MKKPLSLAMVAALLLALFACSTLVPIPSPPLVLGEKYLADLDYEQALLQFDQAISIEPKNPRGYLGKADALLHLNRKEDAASALTDGAKATWGNTRTALKAAQTEVEKTAVDGYIGLSWAYGKLGWREIAIALLQRVCEELPEESRLREALERLAGGVDLLVSRQITEMTKDKPISAEEYAQIKSFVETPFATIDESYSAYAMDKDVFVQSCLGEDYNPTNAYGTQYAVNDVIKLSRNGMLQYINVYNGITFEEYFSYSEHEDIESAREYYTAVKAARWSLDKAEAIYRISVIMSSEDQSADANETTLRWVVSLNRNLYFIATMSAEVYSDITE